MPTDAVRRLARGSNDFGFDLYRRLRDKSGNLVFSPASITTALAMTWGGAKGETAEQMRRVLHLEGAPADVMSTSGKLAAALQDPQSPITFRIANQLFGEKSYRFEQRYLDATKNAYGAPLEPMDFRNGADTARASINGWVEQQTEKRITELLPAKALDDQTRLVLVNAIYFLGDWPEPFAMDSTRPEPFFTAKDVKKDVPTMHRTDMLRFAARDGLTALELPYKGGKMSMLFVVPDAVDGLAAIEQSLDGATLDALVGALTSQLVAVSLPKFKIEPGESLSLGDELQKMGMPLAFDRDRADFTAIANPPEPDDRLYISKVFHKAFVRVDEKGTEASAATAISMARAGGAPPKPVFFKADRPFLFFLRDNDTKLVLFAGRVADPSAK